MQIKYRSQTSAGRGGFRAQIVQHPWNKAQWPHIVLRDETRIFKRELQVSRNPKQDLSEGESWGELPGYTHFVGYFLSSLGRVLKKETGWTAIDM